LLPLGDICKLLNSEPLAPEVRTIPHFATDTAIEIIAQFRRDYLADIGFVFLK
jgi:hypothetical protein